MSVVKVIADEWVVHFDARGKSSPRFIGPYVILELVCQMAYRLSLRNSLEKLHDNFHV